MELKTVQCQILSSAVLSPSTLHALIQQEGTSLTGQNKTGFNNLYTGSFRRCLSLKKTAFQTFANFYIT